MLVTTLKTVHLVHSEAWFAQCYPLNRFLGLILLDIAAPGIRKPETRVVRVTGNGHVCSWAPGTCHGKPHEVWVEDAAKVLTQHSYDVVILRHGLLGPKRFFPGEAVRVRQILPYCVQQ